MENNIRIADTYRLLALLFGILLLCECVSSQKRPPNYSQDDMPVTSFSCKDKIVGGYYADPETDCQMFHVCVHVPGVGIQNFRFLCPNETTFDQEHQICDDWYNIDCELSLYSENFDLYRIGANVEVKKPPVSNKGTPIPLGPSSTIKPWQADTLKNNQYDDEDDYKRNGNDILRGSHSSNFYAGSKRGREDLDDNDYETAPNVGAKRQEVAHSSDTKKQKTLVRKLASKRPVTQKPFQQTYQQQYTETPKPVSTIAPRSQHQSNQNYNQQTSFGTHHKTPKSRGNVNFNSYQAQPQQQQPAAADYQRVTTVGPTTTAAPTIYQRINNLTEFELDNSQEVATQTYDVSRTYENSFNFRQQTNAFNKQKIPAPRAPTYSSSSSINSGGSGGSSTQHIQQQAYTESSVRLPSTDYLRSIAQTYQQPAAVINNQLQDTTRNTFRQTYYPPYRTTQIPTTVNYQQNNANFGYHQPAASATGYQPTTSTRVPQSSVSQNVYYQSSPSPASQNTHAPSNVFYQGYSTPVTYTPQLNTTTFDYNKYYQTSTASPSASQRNANYFYKVYDTNKSNAPSPNPTQYYSTTPKYSNFEQGTGVPPAIKYDPYANFQKINEKYDDEEFLKTAPSSNLKPSDLNAIHNQKKQLYINATLRAAYSVDNAHKSSPISQSPPSPSLAVSQPKPAYAPPPTHTAATATGFYIATSSSTPKSVTHLGTGRSHHVTPQYTQQAHTISQTVPKYVAPSAGAPVSANATKSQDYDYAYYDNGGVSSEYDQVEAIEEDFARIGKVHNTKS